MLERKINIFNCFYVGKIYLLSRLCIVGKGWGGPEGSPWSSVGGLVGPFLLFAPFVQKTSEERCSSDN